MLKVILYSKNALLVTDLVQLLALWRIFKRGFRTLGHANWCDFANTSQSVRGVICYLSGSTEQKALRQITRCVLTFVQYTVVARTLMARLPRLLQTRS